ncbi:phage recombination protein Bet [Paenarthrobacter nicotinovorans]|uniref:Phage recombination protein Bet n=1 Tax=Paenarthrobacter nicotinovorans TaxID=29320 RepID=A0ABT9TGX1_PAENI|nr:phage recombination protein Bet [Paenarthrobacter nicotinovorans]MDQ0100484.1 phage recombination protein Bet [Paenarthrobacter nicotinovorans]
MSTVAVRQQGTVLTIQEGQTEFSPGQVATLRQLGVENATREDLAIFFHQSVRTGLDPFARQIYMIGRWTKQGVKQTIQTGIDGYRLIARRAADRRNEQFGYEDTLWCGEDGNWRDVWLSKSAPSAAKVTVLRKGERFSAVALFSEYAGTNKDGSYTQMWSSKGAIMIAKCAEALALRKAFPQDLSGIYTAEEMAQADTQPAEPAHQPAPSEQPKQEAAPAKGRRKPPTLAEAMAKNAEPAPTADPIEDLGEKRDFLAEAELANGDETLLRPLWEAAKAAGEPQEHLDTIRAMAVPPAADAA